jgi:flagellar hook-basal body complex protein FliE
MSLNYETQSISYSAAVNKYDRQSRFVDRIAGQASEVKDNISIGESKKLEIGGVETNVGQTSDVLAESDIIIPSAAQKTKSFFSFIKDKFDAIKSSETTSSKTAGTTNLLELTASLNEAEIAVQEIVNVRDKIVSAYKEILNSTF